VLDVGCGCGIMSAAAAILVGQALLTSSAACSLHRVLDVGCGCGIMSAAAAFLVGQTGEVVGIDIRQECVDMSAQSCERLRARNPE